MAENQDRRGAKTRIATRFMTPIAAAAASAAAGYVVKRGPDYVERVLLPRLRDLAGDAENMTKDLPGKAASVATGAGDVAQDLTERAKSLVSSDGPASSSGNHRRFTPEQLERRRQDRARSRAARRKPRGA
jgi:hypothetical protein